jgi:hypothetical protein
MNVPVTCRGGLHPPTNQLRLSIVGVASPLENHNWHRVEGRMQSAPTKLGCSLSEITQSLAQISSPCRDLSRSTTDRF